MNFYEHRRISSCLFSHFSPGLQWDCTLWSSFCILPLVCIVPLVCSLQSTVRSLRFIFLHWRVSTAFESTFCSRQINCAFSNTEFRNISGSSKLNNLLSDSNIPPIWHTKQLLSTVLSYFNMASTIIYILVSRFSEICSGERET